MKIIVMGTGPFAVPAAQRLMDTNHDIVLCVTRPLRPSARKKPPRRPVWEWAQQAGIEVFEPESINAPEAITVLQQHQADLLFVCDYGQILSKECLQTTALGGINLHGSLLPRHRGAAPVQWTLLRGDTEAGVSVIHMSPRLDAGPILAKASTIIEADETADELEQRLAQMGADVTVDAVNQLAAWDRAGPIGEPQDAAQVTRAPRLEKRHGQLDVRLPADYLARLVRALQPWPGTFAEMELASGKSLRLIIRRALALEQPWEQLAAKQGVGSDLSRRAAEAGSVLLVSNGEMLSAMGDRWDSALAIATGKGTLLALEVQPAGKRRMTAGEFARGHAIKNARLSLPDPPCEALVSDGC